MARKPAPRADRHPDAIRDLIESADYLARHASLPTADRFLAAAEKTIEQLARMPGLGTRWDSDRTRLAGVRYRPVSRFRKYLVFYRPHAEGGIEVLRVLHGARDLANLLEAEEE
jgi:toxin ParE1/3/4